MKKQVKTFIVSLLYLMAVAFGTQAQTTDRQTETAGQPRTFQQIGGEMVIAFKGKPQHLNSAIASGIHTGIPAAQIFAFLLRLSHNREYQPYLAEKWETSPDGLSVTFHLRPGVTFHDGKPLTSEDVAFSLMTIQKYHPFSDMLSAVEKVDTPDPLTATVPP
jgi:peptide/nickel transport system substrate-binding protein